MRAVIVSILLLIPTLSFAGNATCSEIKRYPDVDLRPQFPPLRQQGKSSWCFAYTSSDLVNYWLKKHRGIDTGKKENQVSAVAIALKNELPGENFVSKLNQKPAMSKLTIQDLLPTAEERRKGITNAFLEGMDGSPYEAIDNILHEGYCTESEVNTLEGGESFKLSREIHKWSFEKKEASLCQAQAAASQLFQERNFNEIKDVLTQATNSKNSITELLEKSCHNKKISAPLPKTVIITNFDKDEAGRQLINENPIALTIDKRILHLGEKSLLEAGMNFSGDHVVSLVGRQFNCETKQMDYIIRDSYGRDACDKVGNGVRCDKGYYIISEAVLQKSHSEMTFLNGN